jgi:hypothetical protein
MIQTWASQVNFWLESSQVKSQVTWLDLTWVIIYNQVTSQVQRCINIHVLYALQFWFLIWNIWKNGSHKNSKHFRRGNSPETRKPNLFLTWIKSSQVASQVTRDLTWKIFWREVTWLDSTWKFFQLCMTWLDLTWTFQTMNSTWLESENHWLAHLWNDRLNLKMSNKNNKFDSSISVYFRVHHNIDEYKSQISVI